MLQRMKASIILTSFNYERYVAAAIESALSQTHPDTEVIVVDDGSSDQSPAIIRSYGSRIRAILKENGGQASAFNAGFRVASGDVICFMDSDDLIDPETISEVVDRLKEGVVKVHWPLRIIDADSRLTGDVMRRNNLAEGDVRDVLLQRGPAGYNWVSTSGNAWTRSFLQRVLPMPEAQFRIGPDVYLAALAPLFGSIAKLDEPRGAYRNHGQNNTYREPFDQRVASAVAFWDYTFDILAGWCRKLGLEGRPEQWREDSFWHETQRAAAELAATVPRGHAVSLVGEQQWVTDEIAGRRILPFVERNGVWWGPPADDDAALAELERQRGLGVTHLAMPWWSFWWEQHYKRFWQCLTQQHRVVGRSRRLVIFDLRESHN